MRRHAAVFEVSLRELSLELDVGYNPLMRQLRREGREVRLRKAHPAHAHAVNCITPQDADALRAHHARHRALPEDVAHWLTAAQAARALCMTVRAFQQRRATGTLKGRIEARNLHGPGVAHNQVRYHPGDVDRESRRLGIRPVTLPAGALSPRDFLRLTGIPKRTLDRWAEARGLPHGVLGSGHRYFYPARVLAWMETQPRSSFGHRWHPFEAARDRLRAHLNQERAA